MPMLIVGKDKQIKIKVKWSLLMDFKSCSNNMVLIYYLPKYVLKQIGEGFKSGYIICIIKRKNNDTNNIIINNFKLYLNGIKNHDYKLGISPKEIMYLSNLYTLFTNFIN